MDDHHQKEEIKIKICSFEVGPLMGEVKAQPKIIKIYRLLYNLKFLSYTPL
jgi:hypothetical protein